MFETTIRFKPRDQWRAGHDAGQADRRARPRGEGARPRQCLGAADPQPHRHAGDRHQEPDRRQGRRARTSPSSTASRARSRRSPRPCPGVSSALAERLTGGRYIDVDIDRAAAARYGLNIADVQAIVVGRDRRRDHRPDGRGPRALSDQRALSARAARQPGRPAQPADRSRRRGQQITLGTVADVAVADGPPMLRSENGRPSTWVYVDVRGRDLDLGRRRPAARGRSQGQAAAGDQRRLFRPVRIPRSAQSQRLKIVVPATLLIIFLLLYADLPALRRGGADHGHAAVRADRRHLDALSARLQPVGRDRRRVHRARRRRRRVRRGDADLPQARAWPMRGRQPETERSRQRCAKARCCASGPRR